MRRNCSVLGLGSALLAVAGCGGTDAEETVPAEGYVLMDALSREAGFALFGDEGRVSSALPRAVDPEIGVALDSPDGVRELQVDAGELVYVHGVDGAITRLDLGQEIALDQVELRGEEEAVIETAEELGAEVIAGEDGAYRLTAPGVVLDLVLLAEVAGLRETVPLTAGSGEVHPAAAGVLGGNIGITVDPPAAAGLAQAGAAVVPVAIPTGVRLSDLGCDDPIAGTWRSRDYSPMHGGYYEFTMHVRRDGTELHGDIESRFFISPSGDPSTACSDGYEDWTVRMPATGSITDDGVVFQGTSWSVAQHRCGRELYPGSYLVDRFSGPADGTDVLSTLNNDGGLMVNWPTRFQRVSCE